MPSMIPRQTRFHTTLLLAGLLTVSMSAQRQHAPDGVTINDDLPRCPMCGGETWERES